MALRVARSEGENNQRELGLRAFGEGRWLDAVECLEKALENDPSDAQAVNALSLAYNSLGDKKKARSILGQAAEKSCDSVEIHRNLAAMLLEGGRILEAADSASKAVEIDPSDTKSVDLLEKIRAEVRNLKPAAKNKGKKQRIGLTQSDIDARLARINKALRKAALVAPESAESKGKATISLCMIAKNEEAYIAECLASAKGVVDEIVVLDTGSTDQTREIAASLGARVHQAEWNDSYSDARNEALAHTTCDWVLVLDADERLDDSAGKVIQKAVRSDAADGYSIYFTNYSVAGSDSDYFVHRTCRLFRNRSEYRFEGRIHERIVPAIEAVGGTVRDLDAMVYHYGYKPEVMEERKKFERYLKLLHAELLDNPGDAFCTYNLGAAYSTKEDYEQAAIYLGRAAELSRPEHEFAAAAYSRLAKAYCSLGKAEEALVCLEEADRKGIRHPELEYEKGKAYLRLGQSDLAINRFSLAIQQGRSGKWIGDPGAYGYKAVYGIAQACMVFGNQSRAMASCKQVLAVKPDDPDALEMLGAISFNSNRHAEAEKQLRRSLEVRPGNPGTLMRLAQLCQSQQRFQESADIYQEVLKAGTDNAEVRFKLATCLHAMGDLDEAEENYLKAIWHKSDLAQVHAALALLYAQQDRVDDSLQCFARTVEIEPAFSEAYFNAGELLYSMGRYMEAADVYQSGLMHDPGNARAFLQLGNCYFRVTAYDAALLSYRQALALNPNYPEAENNLEMAQQSIQLPKAA